MMKSKTDVEGKSFPEPPKKVNLKSLGTVPGIKKFLWTATDSSRLLA